jgi:hypothetical protein
MCKKSGELVDYHLLNCEMADALWNIIFSLVGLAWVIPSRIVDLFAYWKGQCVASVCCFVEDDLVVPYIVYVEGKNDRCFEDGKRTMGGI